MNRIVIAVITAAAGCAVAVPAVLGLSGNPSFSQRIPVPRPSDARSVEYDVGGQLVGNDSLSSSTTRAPSVADDRGHSTEPGDDNGGRRSTSASRTPSSHSSPRSSAASTSDDHGGNRGPGGGDDSSGDDHGHGGHGGDHH